MVSMTTCRGCKTDFIPKRKGQEYHNRECFIKATIRLSVCPECGKEFKRKFTTQVCCSPECAFSYRAIKNTKGVYVKCAFDDKPVYKMQSKLRKNNFCDNVCKIAYLRSDKNKDKKRRHTPEEIEKIRQAGLNRNYDEVFTQKTRQKLRKNARNTILRPDVIEKTRVLNRNRMLNTTLSEKTKQKIKEHARYGIDNYMYKEIPGYYAMHMWVPRYKGKAQSCIDKTTSPLPCKGRFEWSNVDHQYRRNLDDYVGRCTLHHRIYDIKNGLTNPKGKAKRFFAKALLTPNEILGNEKIIIT